MRLKRLTRPRHEAFEHRAATLSQERLGRARRDSLAGDGLPDRKLAATLPAAAAVALCLIQDLRAAEGTWAQSDRSEPRMTCSGSSLCGLAGGLFAPLRSCWSAPDFPTRPPRGPRPESGSPSTRRCRATGGRPRLTPRTRGARARRVAARAVGSGRPRVRGPCILARGLMSSRPATRSSRNLASPQLPDNRNAGCHRASSSTPRASS